MRAPSPVGKRARYPAAPRRPAAALEAAVNMLQKIQLLVAGGKGKIVTSGPFAAFLCAKGRIGEHQIIAFHILACGGQGVGKQNFPFNTVQHGVHQGQTVRVVHQLAAGEGFTFLEGRLILVQIKILVGLPFQVLIRRDHKTKGAAGRSLQCSPTWGFMRRTITSMSTRGVKYWPAPDFFSLAFFSSRPS